MEYLKKAPKSHRYAIGFFCLLALAILYLFWGTTKEFVAYSFFSVLFIFLSYEDVMGYVLPTKITYPCLFLAVVYAIFLLDMSCLESIAGVIVGYSSFSFLVWLTSRGKQECEEAGLGGGDVVLMGLIGGLCGFFALGYVLALATIFALLIALYLCVVKGRQIAGCIIPFGPCLCLAAYLSFFM